MIIGTLYSPLLGFKRITDILQKSYPKGILTVSSQDGSQFAELEIKGGLFGSSKRLKISYRQRANPSYQLPEADDSPLTRNLKGLYGFVGSMPAKNEKVRSLFLNKIQTFNSECSVQQEEGETKELKSFIQTLAQELDAVLFVPPNTLISKSGGQHFLDKNLNLLLDAEGNCEVENLEVKIDAAYFDGPQEQITEDQKERKAKSELVIEQKQVKINRNLPFIKSENTTTIRTPKEVAQRVCILATTNLVAFNSISNEEAINYLKKYHLWELVTPNEKSFLADPTEERKSLETWKCEGIWTLMWALKKLETLGFPDELCNLGNIPADDYPIGATKDPNNFINSISEIRTKTELLNANDLYYRLDWACVDARIKKETITAVHPGVVYERHYALNWLINYREQEWDDVSCDT